MIAFYYQWKRNELLSLLIISYGGGLEFDTIPIQNFVRCLAMSNNSTRR